MTRTEYHTALHTLGWSSRELARQIGRSEGTVSNWHKPGDKGYAPPAAVADWLRRAADAYSAWKRDNPPPG